MAKRRVKKHTHVRAGPGINSNAQNAPSNNLVRSPKSMVIRIGAGEVGPSVSQLAKDVRRMLEPDTASRLKERRANKLRDYTVMAGPLGVTHLLLFSKSETGNTHLRIALTPRGPTLTFRIERYSLCKDIIRAQKRPQSYGDMHKNPPLLVMNNFMSSGPDPVQESVPKHLESLTTTVFQSLFPPISPQTTPLSTIRRVMLVNREIPSGAKNTSAGGAETAKDDAYVFNLRHFSITTRRRGMPKRIRRLDASETRHRDHKNKAVPNLGKLTDVSDYLLDPSAAGYTSASETELDTDAEVEVVESTAKKVLNKRELQLAKAAERKRAEELAEKGQEQEENGRQASSVVEKRAVKLVELGPRLKLRLIKVEEGMCSGKVMWHAFVKGEREGRDPKASKSSKTTAQSHEPEALADDSDGFEDYVSDIEPENSDMSD